jgi:hypothetical protein
MHCNDILKFNELVAWIQCGTLTKLAIAKEQHAQSNQLAQSMANDGKITQCCSSKHDTLKQLTITHMVTWEKEVFEDHYHRIQMPDYISNSISTCNDPIQLHGCLLVEATTRLLDCLKTVNLCPGTRQSIGKWFVTLKHLLDLPLGRLLAPEHFDKLKEMEADYNNHHHEDGVEQRFPLFSYRALLITLAYVVEMKYSHDTDMEDRFEKWAFACGGSIPRVCFPNIDDPEEYKFENYEFKSGQPIAAHSVFWHCLSHFCGNAKQISMSQASCIDEHHALQRFCSRSNNIMSQNPKYLKNLLNCQKQMIHYNKQHAKNHKPRDKFKNAKDMDFIFGCYFSMAFAEGTGHYHNLTWL